ncbi:hypothetical protein [Thermogymnomonas acidicola]|uniref:hypothetical protein n=1 Tax=Thermogymnomonas acidicola TaxID=399579 RepID=UPI00094634AC|nr:hypothetical protein [Thermogymnomonas acidicola]
MKYAQSMGVAETDYRDDTSGLDAARKTVILANSLFGLSMSLNDLYYEGIDEGKRYRSSSRMVSTVSVEGGRVRAESRVEELSQEDPPSLLARGIPGLHYRDGEQREADGKVREGRATGDGCSCGERHSHHGKGDLLIPRSIQISIRDTAIHVSPVA